MSAGRPSSLEPQYAWRGARGPSLRALVGDAPVRLDPEGVRAAFGETEPTDATCVAGARRLGGAHVPGRKAAPRPLRGLLEEACARIPAGRVALGLSGGVDSAVLAALLRGRAAVYTLAAALPGYGEEAEALAVARSLGLGVTRVPAGEADFVGALPDVIRAAETPLYNLHPVGRHLLARAARADGAEILVTGDGADEVFRDTSGADLLPIVGALGRAAGLATIAPFLDPGVAPFVAVDPDKGALRVLALELGVPREIALRPKRPRFAPPLCLARHADPARIAALGLCLGRAPSADTDRARVAWTTLALLVRCLPGLALPCAA